LKAAVKEYKRRYKRSPPPGFQQWFEYAIERNSPIIDDFDIINEAITPFWSMSGEEVLKIMREVEEEADGAHLWSCQVKGGQWVEPCMEGTMLKLLNSFQANLPDVKLFFNGLDEPRLLSTSPNKDSEWWKEKPHQNVWADLHGPCESSLGQTKNGGQHLINTHGIPFVQSTLDAVSICKHPEYENLHGMWMSPSEWIVTPAKVPLLSPGRPSTMRDMLYPAAAYTQDRYMYDVSKDKPFADKHRGLYWTGSTAGGFVARNTPQDVWKQFHRQRFVRFTNGMDRAEDERDAYLAYNSTTNTWGTADRSDGLRRKDHYYVHFNNIVQCEPAACKAQRAYFAEGTSFADAISDADDTLSYALVMDLDGNGPSERYYQLLGSRSLPLKQTVLREWHDDRLVAWAHYVPISMGLEELPEIVRFLSEEERGERLAEELAEKGKAWHARALRPVDQAIYLYRLILEIARLQDVGRKGGML
jgi:hypothetical protein